MAIRAATGGTGMAKDQVRVFGPSDHHQIRGIGGIISYWPPLIVSVPVEKALPATDGDPS
jgi:hypothetical protein